MSASLSKLVLSAVLVVMPLQGIAATVSALLCNNLAQQHSKDAGADLDRGAYHGNPHQNDGGSAGETAHHPCFHYTAFALPAEALQGALPDFSSRAIPPSPLHDLFVPDRPQRPPLA